MMLFVVVMVAEVVSLQTDGVRWAACGQLAVRLAQCSGCLPQLLMLWMVDVWWWWWWWWW